MLCHRLYYCLSSYIAFSTQTVITHRPVLERIVFSNCVHDRCIVYTRYLFWQLFHYLAAWFGNALLTCALTCRVRRSRGEMYIGHGRLCVCLSLAAFPHCCTYPDVTWRNGWGFPIVVHYWLDLQSGYGFRCYDNIAPNAKCQRVLVLFLCLVSLL